MLLPQKGPERRAARPNAEEGEGDAKAHEQEAKPGKREKFLWVSNDDISRTVSRRNKESRKN